jgi:hypothetical protein
MTHENPRFTLLLDALRRASAFLDRFKREATPGVEVLLPQEIALFCLLRTEELLKASVVLLDQRMCIGAEPHARMLFEMAFNLAWIGSDLQRAERFRDDGLRESEKWFAERTRDGNLTLPQSVKKWFDEIFAKQSGTERLPDRRTRTQEIEFAAERFKIEGMPRSYLEYKRLSAAVHCDYWHLRFFANPDDAALILATLILTAQDTAGAASFVLMIAGEILGLSAGVAATVSDLRSAVEQTLGRER